MQQGAGASIEYEFSPRLHHPDHLDTLARQARQSAATRAHLSHEADIRYGAKPRQTLDVFHAAPERAPVHVFVHGGYWRALDKSVFSRGADALAPAGAVTVIVGYDLCPEFGIDDIVQEIREAVVWVYRNASTFGGDPQHLYVSGHSAGAQLVAMALAHRWSDEGVPADPVKGAVLISGLYRLEPVVELPVNATLGLTMESARRNSPMSHKLVSKAPLVVAAAADETATFIDMSRDYAAYAEANGVAAEFLLVEDAGHFTIIDKLTEADHKLTAAMLAQMGLFRPIMPRAAPPR